MFLGSFCQAETITCSPNPCQNYAQCSDTGINTISCACRGTGYEGDYCQTPKEGDCRAASHQCPSTALCIVDVMSDTASCRCDSRYIGDTCDIDLVFLIAVPLAMILVVGIYFFLNHRYPKARNIAILTVALTIYDFVTDVLFAFSEKTDSPTLFATYLTFTIVPMVFNFVLLARIFVSSIQDDHSMRGWLKNNHATTAATAVLALTNIESFSLLQSNLFHNDGFNAPFNEKVKHHLMIGGLMGNILEDIPQLIIQSIAASTTLDTITLLSMVASILTISSGLVKHLIIFLVAKFQGIGQIGYRKQSGEEEMHGDWVLTTPYSTMTSTTGGEEKEAVTASKAPAMKWTTKEVVAWLEESGLSPIARLAESKRWTGALLYVLYDGRRKPLFDVAMKAVGIEDPPKFAEKLEMLF